MTAQTVAPTVASALDRFGRALAQRFGARLREVVLYGSHARGTAHEDSDVDVLVVVDDLTFEEADAVARMAYFVDAEEGHAWAGLEPLAMSTAHAADLRGRERLLMRDIEREGVRLP
ncbi:MAG TPA: nucleotidyltransferase domain-containing protein [Polyangiaceae bacterium]